LSQTSIPFEYPPTNPGNLGECTQAELKFAATEKANKQVTYTVSATLNPGRHCDRGPSIAVLEFFVLNPALLIQWETQTYAYTWQDVAASVFSTWGMSLTLLAFLFPWQEPAGEVKQRKFVLDRDSSSPQQEVQDKDARDKSIPLAQWEDGSQL
jgi:hypothetical protein